MEFKKEINELFVKIIIWFQTNLLSLNLNKTYYMQFLSKSNYVINVNIIHKTIQISNVHHTNFLGLTLDSTLSWKPHIDQLISKLNSAYVIRSLKSLIPLETKNDVFLYCTRHHILRYNFWGATPVTIIPFLNYRRQ